MLLRAFIAAALLWLTAPLAMAQNAQHEEGVSARGAHWAIDRPAHWNGTLLLYARGYAPGQPNAAPATAPRDARDWLLAQGYALAASNYSGPDWALEEAPADQIEALDAFIARHGTPRRVIAWGHSMGGLVTLALSERHAERIDGALSMCGSASGSLGMLNTALDGAFAFRTLLAPNSDIRIVGIDDDRANATRVAAVLRGAMTTPEGRARVALAATLAQIPPWTAPNSEAPAARDWDAQLEQMAQAFVMGVFLPRVDQERRAGGVTSWNVGVDYAAQLRASGRTAFVRALYDAAGLDLDADIATLNAAPRIAADPDAVAYMRANYVPSGRIGAPTLVMHEIGDGLTIPNVARAFADAARRAGDGAMTRSVFVNAAGHCRFNLAETVGALRTLEARLDTGRWRVTPQQMNARGAGIGDAAPRFMRHRPAPLLRACGAAPGSCPGEPALRRAAWQRDYRRKAFVVGAR